MRATSVRAYRRAKGFRHRLRLSRDLQWWREHSGSVIESGRRRPHAGPEVLDLRPQQHQTLHARAHRDGLAVVARIDLDGQWHSQIGPITGVPMPEASTFRPRAKFFVDVVWCPAYFGVRKHYAGNHVAFLNELSILNRLGEAGLRVPAILDIDFEAPSLVLSYLPGKQLREALVEAGAPIRNSDFVLGRLGGHGWRRALDAGRTLLPRVARPEFLEALARDLERFHALGIIVRDIKWDNIIIGTDGRPWWIDFHSAEYHGELPRSAFTVLAALDLERFARLIDARIPKHPQALS
jgi:tRNA A-37 threonylcarbamoyl transferase component Bud32